MDWSILFCREKALFLFVLQWSYTKVSHSSLETEDIEAHTVRQVIQQLPYF